MSLAVAIKPAAVALRVYAPDPGEWDRVIGEHLATVERLARRYSRGRGIDPDLYQEGCLALVRAAARLDWDCPGFGDRIKAAVRKEILRAATGTVAGVVSLGVSARRDRRRVRASRERLAGPLGRTATAREVCDDLKATGARRAALVGLIGLMDAPPADAAGVEAARVGGATAALACLGGRWREAVSLRYGLGGEGPLSLDGVAARMGVGRKEATTLVREAIETMRDHMERSS